MTFPMAAPPFDAFCPRNDQVALWAPGRGGAEDDMSAPTLRTPSYATMGPHNYKVRLCRPRFSHTRGREGVSLWFSGQRLLTDGTSENPQNANFAITEF